MCICLCRLWEKIRKLFNKSKNKKTQKRLKEAEDQYIQVIVSFVIALLLYLTIPILIEIFKNNFDTYFKYAILVATLVVVVVFYLIFSIISHRLLRITIPLTFFLGMMWVIMHYPKLKYLSNASILLFILFYPLLIKRFWKQPNWWIQGGTVFAIVLLFVGLLSIDAFYGERKWNYPLNYCEPTRPSEWAIHCTNRDNNKAIVGYNLSCKEEPTLINATGTITFEFYDGKHLIKPYNNFIIPPNVVWIRFEIYGANTFNQTICLSDSTIVKVPTYKEHREDNNKLVTSFLGLLGFIVISIPLILNNLIDILEKTKETKHRRKTRKKGK